MSRKLPEWANDFDITGRTAAKSAGIAVGSGLARLIASFAGALVLARFLSPEDFGLVAIATPLILLVGAFADGGVSTYTLQSKQVSSRELTLSFWLALCSGLGVGLAVILLSPLAAWIFEDERLVLILCVLSASIVFSSIASQHNALTKKFHRQDLYGISEIVAAFCSLVVAVYIAYVGGGYWALVSIPVTRQVTHTLSIWLLTKWVPGRPYFDRKLAGVIMGFSGYIIIFQTINVLNKSIDKWMLGYNQSAEVLGYYAMAVSIMMLPSMQLLSPIGGAIIPHLSKVYHDDPDRFGPGVHEISVILICLICPCMIWASVYSDMLLVTVLGAKWLPSSPIFSVLALASIAMTMLSIVGWTYTSVGNSRLLSNLAIVSVVLLTLTSGVASLYGGLAMAWTLLLNFLFMIILYFSLLLRDRNLSVPVVKIFRDVSVIICWAFLVVYAVQYIDSKLLTNPYLSLMVTFFISLFLSLAMPLLVFKESRLQIVGMLSRR